MTVSSLENQVTYKWFMRSIQIVAICIFLAQFVPIAAFGQTVVIPQVTNANAATTFAPACAASANGTGHIICVVGDTNNNLSAVSAMTEQQAFPATPLDPATNNPLPLGVVGMVGRSSCASTADISGDVVCAFVSKSSGLLMGIRFNIFSGKIYPVENLGIAAGGLATCTNGNQRFSVTGPPASEGPEGATICVIAGTPRFLTGVAFNPATGYLELQEFPTSGFLAPVHDPSCVNANDQTNQVICVYEDGEEFNSFAFDPRPSPQFLTAVQRSNDPDLIDPETDISCDTPNDGSGDLLCAMRGEGSYLQAFAIDPRKGYQSPIQTIYTNLPYGNIAFPGPSCAGVDDTSNAVVCVLATDPVPYVGGYVIEAFKFDPRVGPGYKLGEANIIGRGGVSCTFENMHPNQISCAGIEFYPTTGSLFFTLFDL